MTVRQDRTDAWADDDDGPGASFKPLTREEAARLREQDPPLSPWRVVAAQAAVGAVVALASWLLTGRWEMVGSALYGVAVLLVAAWNLWRGVVPEPATMAIVGFLALAVNVSVAMLLYAFRGGDANMKSVWLCSRNDAIGNVAVMLAAAGVFGTGTIWPDVAVAVVLGLLGLSAGRSVGRLPTWPFWGG